MTDEPQKKPVRKTAAKRVTPATEGTKAPAKRKVAPKKGPKLIRNLHEIGVHVRIDNPMREKKFRIELKPRGSSGDTASVPVELQDSHEYRTGVGTLFEVITETEYRAIDYPQVGYTPRLDTPTLVREADNVKARFRNVDKEIQEHPRRPVSTGRVDENVGMNVVAVPGSAPLVNAGSESHLVPEGAKTNADILKTVEQPKVVIERGHRVN